MSAINMTGREFNLKYNTRLYLQTDLECQPLQIYSVDGPNRPTIFEGTNLSNVNCLGQCIGLSPYQYSLVNEHEFNFYLWDITIPDNAQVGVYSNYIRVHHFYASNRRTVFDMDIQELNHWISKNENNRKWIESEAFKRHGGLQLAKGENTPNGVKKSWKGLVRSFGMDFLD